MRHNHYDEQTFFDQYAQMSRSQEGLSGAGEWWQLKPLLPSLEGKRVLDLGCGYGWHCKYAADQGAKEVLGLDLSEKMIAEARRRNAHPVITYQVGALEQYDYPEGRWDCAISNLTLHYIADLEGIYRQIRRTLTPDGVFIFNIEHPVFTAGVGQDWAYGEDGKPLYWPVDDYFLPGERKTHFLGSEVIKQHHTLTQILMGLLDAGFALEAVVEARPSEEMVPLMPDELRRPMMFLVRARVK